MVTTLTSLTPVFVPVAARLFLIVLNVQIQLELSNVQNAFLQTTIETIHVSDVPKLFLIAEHVNNLPSLTLSHANYAKTHSISSPKIMLVNLVELSLTNVIPVQLMLMLLLLPVIHV
jgi:hypothetical protein